MTESRDPLNRLRAELGELDSPPRSSRTFASIPSLGRVADAGRARAERLDDGVRLGLLIAGIVGLVVLTLHGLVLGAVSHGGSWWQHGSEAALAWPAAWFQPAVGALAAAGIAAVAIATAGFTKVRPWQSVVLAVLALGAGLACIPLALLLLGWIVAIVVMIAVVIFLLWAFLGSS